MGLRDVLQVRETPPEARVEHADRPGLRHRLQEDLEALGVEFGGEHVHPRDVAAGPGETRHHAGFEQALAAPKRHDDRDGGGRLLGRENRRRTHRDNEVDRRADQVRRQGRQPLELVLGRPDLEARRLAVDVAEAGATVQTRLPMGLSAGVRYPMRQTFAAGCAVAVSGTVSRLRVSVTRHPTAL